MSRFISQDKATRLTTLQALLSEGAKSISELITAMRDAGFYAGTSTDKDARRVMERDIASITGTLGVGSVVVDRAAGSRYVYYRLATAPTRSVEDYLPDPAKEVADKKSIEAIPNVALQKKYSVKEVANLRNVSPRRVQFDIKEGKLKAEKFSFGYLIDGQDLQEFLTKLAHDAADPNKIGRRHKDYSQSKQQ